MKGQIDVTLFSMNNRATSRVGLGRVPVHSSIAWLTIWLSGWKIISCYLRRGFVARDAPGKSSSSSLNLSCTQSLLRD